MDFVQTMKDWRRMCQYMSEEYGDKSCDRCPLEGCAAIYEDNWEMDYADVKNKVGAWAAEHPEPVYPTWADWFRQIGIAPRTQSVFHKWLLEPIPADIAQKLGIEPKEDV